MEKCVDWRFTACAPVERTAGEARISDAELGCSRQEKKPAAVRASSLVR